MPTWTWWRVPLAGPGRSSDQGVAHGPMHDLGDALMPLACDALDGIDLKVGLERLADAARHVDRLTVEVRFDDTIRGRLPPAQSADVLYAVLEAVTNAIHHARASRLSLRAAVDARRLVLGVADDGQGFDPVGIDLAPQRGLLRMQARAESANAMLQIESARGAGTIVTLTVPLPERPGRML